jgi:phenylalanyl-tRNA synthetase beta chain
VDFYDIKGVAEKLLGTFELKSSSHPYYMPGYQADVVRNGVVIGSMGCLHGDILAMLDLEGDIYALELPLGAVIEKEWQGLREIPKFPATWRDLSLVVDEATPYSDIVKVIRGKGIAEIRQVSAVDVYTGEKLPAGKKGITIRITYQSESRTLEDAMINEWQNGIIQSLARDFGITLRQ